MNTVDKLEELLIVCNELIEMNVDNQNRKFKLWYDDVKFFIKKQYGEKSIEENEFGKIHFHTFISYYTRPSSQEKVRACEEGLIRAKNFLENCLIYLENNKDENLMNEQQINEISTCLYNKVFIVHGHDGELKYKVARLIEQQNIEAIILDEQVNQGRTIIEKFEENSDVGGAICLFTADDSGKSKKSDTEHDRARQNVVFETGYFMGKLGRQHVIVIYEECVEMPSDLSGIAYTDKNNWEVDVLKGLKAMGYTIDFNKLY